MTLEEAESYARESNRSTLIETAEVIPTEGLGGYGLVVTYVDGSQCVSFDEASAADSLMAIKMEEDSRQAVYATLGEGNVAVLCDRKTWKAWSDANGGRVVVKSKQSAGLLTELCFTGQSSIHISPDEPRFWLIDFHNLEDAILDAGPSFTTLEEADSWFESSQ
jgi:hypothetical protein